LPQKGILSLFSENLKSSFDEIDILSSEIESLKNLRDTLLPKLISGELEINESILD